jgi:hypothetical protein
MCVREKHDMSTCRLNRNMPGGWGWKFQPGVLESYPACLTCLQNPAQGHPFLCRSGALEIEGGEVVVGRGFFVCYCVLICVCGVTHTQTRTHTYAHTHIHTHTYTQTTHINTHTSAHADKGDKDTSGPHIFWHRCCVEQLSTHEQRQTSVICA